MRAIAVLILALLVPSHAAWAQSEERTIYATVVDKQDAPVTGLTTGAFIVRENDIAREVLRVSPATAPMQIALLVDTSQAIDNFIIDFRTGVQKFIKRMAGKNEIMLMGFGERPTQLVDFTRDGARLEKAMGSVFARQGSGDVPPRSHHRRFQSSAAPQGSPAPYRRRGRARTGVQRASPYKRGRCRA